MKKRYVIAHRQGAVLPANAEAAMETALAGVQEIRTVRRLTTGQRVVELEEEAARRLAEQHPELLIEEDQELQLFSMPGLPPRVPSRPESQLHVEVTAAGDGAPLAGVTIFALGKTVVYEGETGPDGKAAVPVHETELQRIIASPRRGYWSQVTGPVSLGRAAVQFKLQELPVNGGYQWGPLALGVDAVKDRFSGRGVKVAIVDSGIAPHEDLTVAGGQNTLDGGPPEAWNVDEKGHGTHCAGTLAALDNRIGTIGIAPGAEVYSVKVFPGGYVSDLVEAVNWCIENAIDVISMSLGSPAPSQALQLALQDATSRGIVCVAAAGNDAGPVAYPAAFDEVIAVSAIGKAGSFPDDSGHALRIGPYWSSDRQYFSASFTNYGEQIEVCAPGVAVLSPVPEGYACWDGTSMACPMIAGFVALLLEGYPQLRTGDGWTSYYVRSLLRDSCVDLGLPPQIQGAGLPHAGYALAQAMQEAAYSDEQAVYYRRYLEGMLDRTRQVTRYVEDALAALGNPT